MLLTDKKEKEQFLIDSFFSSPGWEEELNEEDIFGETPLYKAAKAEYYRFAEELVRQGARWDVEVPGEQTLLTLLYVHGTKDTVKYISETDALSQVAGGPGMAVIDCLLYASSLPDRSIIIRLRWLLDVIWKANINNLTVEFEYLSVVPDMEEEGDFSFDEEVVFSSLLDVSVNTASADLLRLYFKLGGRILNRGTDYLGYIRKIKLELAREELEHSSSMKEYFDQLRDVKTLLVRQYNKEMKGSV